VDVPVAAAGGPSAADTSAPKRLGQAAPSPVSKAPLHAPAASSSSSPATAVAKAKPLAPKPATSGLAPVFRKAKAKAKSSEVNLLLQLDKVEAPISAPNAPSANINDTLTQAEKARFSAATGRAPESMVVVFDVPSAPQPLVWEDVDEDSDETFGDNESGQKAPGEKRKSATSRDGRHKRPKLPDFATGVLKKWIREHRNTPYPTEEEKAKMATTTGLSLFQINNWFSNARRRLLKKN
jgi:hypothetical protein